MKPYLLILAGGLGTRLQSVVPNCPKPMAIVNEKPFLVRLLDDIINQDIDCEIFISVGYLANQIVDYFQDCYKGHNIRYVFETEPLGTGGAIKKFVTEFKVTEPFLVKNGDTFSDTDLASMLKIFNNNNFDVLLSAFRIENSIRYGTIVCEDSSICNNDALIVEQFGENNLVEISSLINTGTYVIEPKYIQQIKEKKFAFEDKLLLCRDGLLRLGAIEMSKRFIDIGIPDDFLRSQSMFK
jgi:D-glycero-alpha-D-manno-heptose 1-phosphate guanylyltransferase